MKHFIVLFLSGLVLFSTGATAVGAPVQAPLVLSHSANNHTCRKVARMQFL